jgi:hypothetical protein
MLVGNDNRLMLLNRFSNVSDKCPSRPNLGPVIGCETPRKYAREDSTDQCHPGVATDEGRPPVRIFQSHVIPGAVLFCLIDRIGAMVVPGPSWA